MGVHILICDMPRLLMDVVSEVLRSEPGIAVNARLDRIAVVAPAVRAMQPDVVILQQNGEPSLSDHARLFRLRAGLRIVVISCAGRFGTVHRAGAQPTTVSRLSATRLVLLVRGTVHRAPRGRHARCMSSGQ